MHSSQPGIKEDLYRCFCLIFRDIDGTMHEREQVIFILNSIKLIVDRQMLKKLHIYVSINTNIDWITKHIIGVFSCE